jgi:hypothetical protein
MMNVSVFGTFYYVKEYKMLEIISLHPVLVSFLTIMSNFVFTVLTIHGAKRTKFRGDDFFAIIAIFSGLLVGILLKVEPVDYV